MIIQSTRIVITNLNNPLSSSEENELMIDIILDCIGISAITFNYIRKLLNAEIFTVSLRDIKKALRSRTRTDSRTKLLPEYHDFLDVFDCDITEKLSLHWSGVDHSIKLERMSDGIETQSPGRFLYTMSKKELLILRKTLLDYLDKSFIRISQSSAAVFVLFMKKSEEGLQFYIDYGALNYINHKDRYLLSLIQETFSLISKAKYFIKLDIIAIFHKIQITTDDKWKIVFRTGYSLYKGLMTSFGLANTSSIFQKYINWALQDFLDEFCSAYVDDILIYTDDSSEEYREHIRKIFEGLQKAGL